MIDLALTEKELGQMMSMDDEAFGKLIAAITKAAGGDEKKAAALSADIPSLKKMMACLTPGEVEKLLGKAGKDKSQSIYDAINGGTGDFK